MSEYKITLAERDIPKTWYNVIPDLPAPMDPPLHPGTGKPAGPADLAAIFPPGTNRTRSLSQPTDPRSGSGTGGSSTLATYASVPGLST